MLVEAEQLVRLGHGKDLVPHQIGVALLRSGSGVIQAMFLVSYCTSARTMIRIENRNLVPALHVIRAELADSRFQPGFNSISKR